eukprot:gene65406-89467_t
MSLDIDFVRSQFPALETGWAFFDNAGGSAVLKAVADRVHDYLITTSVQTGASYVHSQRIPPRSLWYLATRLRRSAPLAA